MRDRETIDSELRRIALGREQGRQPSSREVDELLDELLAHSSGKPYPDSAKASDTVYVPEAWLRISTKTATKPRRRKSAVRRFGLLAVLPLSLVAVVVAAVVVIISLRQQYSSEQAAQAPPSEAAPAKPAAPAAPTAPAPPVNVVDMAFVATLKHEGIPVPSQEYVTSQGHAVCDFLAHQRNFADAVGFVQRSSIWDADQSANVTAGAIVSYCPQSQPSAADELQPAYQNALSDLQAAQGKLKDIQGDLGGLQGVLDGIAGRQ
jgi:Protein of unknown function (DUF732)